MGASTEHVKAHELTTDRTYRFESIWILRFFNELFTSSTGRKIWTFDSEFIINYELDVGNLLPDRGYFDVLVGFSCVLERTRNKHTHHNRTERVLPWRKLQAATLGLSAFTVIFQRVIIIAEVNSELENLQSQSLSAASSVKKLFTDHWSDYVLSL